MTTEQRASASGTGEITTLVQLLRQRSRETGGGYAFVDDASRGTSHLGYGELDRNARRIGALLRRHASLGDRALLLYPPGLDFISAYFGCMYAGVIAVPAYPPDPTRLDHSLSRLQGVAADAEPRLVLTTRAGLSLASAAFERVPELKSPRWLATNKVPDSLTSEWAEPDIGSADVAFLQYTSGSTGSPKGVAVTHANLLANTRRIGEAFQGTQSSRMVSWLPQYHDLGLIGGVIAPLYHAMPSCLMSPIGFIKNPLAWLELLSAAGPVCSGGPNFAFDFCVRRTSPRDRARLDLSGWQVAFTAGEPIRADTLARFCDAFSASGFRSTAFQPCYGLAEATLLVTSDTARRGGLSLHLDARALEAGRVEGSRAGERSRTLVSCGRTLPDQCVAIVDPRSQTRCGVREIGEIWVAGPSIASGYWRRPLESEATFSGRLAGVSDERFLRTGDLGFLDQAGELFVTGRLKDLIIIRGLNHSPQDIEATVEQAHPAIRPGCSAAFSVGCECGEDLVVACEVAPAAHFDCGELRRVLADAIFRAHQLAVAEVVVLEPRSLPKTSSGKVQRFACRDAYRRGDLAVLGEPRNDPGETRAQNP